MRLLQNTLAVTTRHLSIVVLDCSEDGGPLIRLAEEDQSFSPALVPPSISAHPYVNIARPGLLEYHAGACAAMHHATH